MEHMNKLVLVGLGNPNMDGTRHNLGIEVLRLFVERQDERGKVIRWWQAELQFEADVATVIENGREIACLFPTTSMNDSGRAVKKYLEFYKLPPSSILIIHDELELPLGEVRLDEGGSARGHNGVRSIHETLGNQTFARLRLGIGRPEGQMPVDRYVLEKFTEAEQTQLELIRVKAVETVVSFIEQRRSQE